MSKMLKFVDLKRETPEKFGSESRKDNFFEIYKEFIDTKAKEQASRCSQCGTPFCQVHCPLQNNIPDWLKLTAEGRLKDAYEVSAATNSLPEVCGSICPQDRLCEGNCVIEQSGHGTVTIGAVEKFITNTAWDNGWIKPIVPLTELKQSVGIIGSGPAGIAAAMELRKEGYQVTVYDRYDRAGKDVVVIGGGDTAMDCVRTAVRQKAKSVSCLYRRDKANMPGSAREVTNAEEEGVKFIWLSSPKVFEGNEKVEKVVVNKMRLGEPDSSGRQSPKIIEGSEEVLNADLVIEALGFEPEEIPKLFNEPDLQVTKWGTIKADLKTLKTNIKGVFAAGDIVRGASLVVWAIRDGRDAAKGISQYLNQISKNKVKAA